MTHIARYLFAHRADLLAALVYGCLAYLSFNALADYANAHHLFPEPQGGWVFAVAVDGATLYAFISFRRAPWLAGTLLVSGAAATYTLQRWHAEGHLHPLVVAGVVPGAMLMVTFAWHAIREAEDRPTWITEPFVPLGPEVPDEPAPDQEPDQPERTKVARNNSGRPNTTTSARLGRPRNGTLTKADMQALDRARKDPARVERVMVRRGLDRSLVAARPERWPLPSRNGNGPT
jgi:hypothetical protein